jgi:hypothetical protein
MACRVVTARTSLTLALMCVGSCSKPAAPPPADAAVTLIRDAALAAADATASEPPPAAPVDAAAVVVGDAAAPPAPAGCAGGGATEVRTLGPKLFRDGANPTGDRECWEVLNPERGFFEFHDLRALGPLAPVRERGFTLIYGKVHIPEYRARDLDAALLDRLGAAFAAVRAAGLKVLPRIYYADDLGQPDAPLDRVLAHLQQLTPLLRANADVIAVLHPGFVGAWGEWHGSTNGLTEPAARKKIYDALLAALPADRTTLSRRPSFKQEAYGGPLTAATAFSGEPLARVGHLNDCFLASEDDLGTYQRPGERDYALADSAFVPVGGETCGPFPPRSACPSALEELARFHWSFLNADYHPEVISGWREARCFETIQCRLGYRFLVLRHETPARAKRGETLDLSVRLTNDGYARLYNPRPVQLVLAGPERQQLPVTADPRRWGPGETIDLCLEAHLPAAMPPGRYQLGLALPDAAPSLADRPAYSVRIPNLVWDAATGTNLLDAYVMVE